MSAPTLKLSNGLTVVNFSSPHPFQFDTGETLAACEADRSRALSLNVTESPEETEIRGIPVTVVRLTWHLSDEVRAELQRLEAQEDIDVVLVALPVMEALRASGELDGFKKVFVIRSADRVTKTIFSSKFCR